MPDSARRHLLRFLKKPSLFQLLDDSLADKTRLVAIALELEPREVDRGKLSFWEVDGAQSERFVVAAFAARRPRRDRIDVLRLPLELFLELEIQTEAEPDRTTFKCIRDRHRTLDLASKAKRLELAEAICNRVTSQGVDREDIHYRIRRGEIEEVLRNANRECRNLTGAIDVDLVSEWARSLA
jgi:hypothetical protein